MDPRLWDALRARRRAAAWTPRESFDWATGGRALSKAELDHLRKLLVAEGRGQTPRQPSVPYRAEYRRVLHDRE